LCAEELHESMLRWGTLNTLIGLYTAMLSPLGVLNRPDFAEICGRMAVLYGRLGDVRESRACYEQALGVFRERGDGYGEAVTLANQGELFRSMGEWEKARSNFERALVLNQQYGDEYLQSVLLHNLGLLFQATKDYTRALRCYVESLKIAHRFQGRDQSSSYNEGMILSNMGFLLYEQEHLPEAIALLSYSVQVRQSLHDPAVGVVIDFLHALEQKMGPAAFTRLRSSPAGRDQSSPSYNLGTHDLISRLLHGQAQGTAPTDTQ
jgi:tetratricopeptide (TPR) repeat protein